MYRFKNTKHLPAAHPSMYWHRSMAGLILLLLFCACEDRQAYDEVTSDTTAVSEPQQPMTTPQAQANTIDVTLTEYEITMPDTIPAGPVVFRITNAGQEEHSFEVEGDDFEEELEHNLAPGATDSLRVDLSPGPYTIYCPVADHVTEGMNKPITVGSANMMHR